LLNNKQNKSNKKCEKKEFIKYISRIKIEIYLIGNITQIKWLLFDGLKNCLTDNDNLLEKVKN